jgi:hypothetical protein
MEEPLQYAFTPSVEETTSNYFRPNDYARVIGVLKNFRGRNYINAFRIVPVQNPHEIFFHIADIIALYVQRENYELELVHCALRNYYFPSLTSLSATLSLSTSCFNGRGRN